MRAVLLETNLTSSKYGQWVPKTTLCAGKGIFDSPIYTVLSEYLLLLNNLECGQHYYLNIEISLSHLLNPLLESESGFRGIVGVIVVEFSGTTGEPMWIDDWVGIAPQMLCVRIPVNRLDT